MDLNNEIHLLEDVLINNSIENTSNYIINKYKLNNNIYNIDDDILEVVGEIDILNEDIWKNDINKKTKLFVAEDILFCIYQILYNNINKHNDIKTHKNN